MLITPTIIGSILAGVACWLLFWFGVNHVDSIPYLNQYLSKRMILAWIKESPHTAFIATEIINVLFHGMGSVGAVMFTFSGSLVNATMIYGVVPVQNFIGVCVSKMKAQAAELKAEVEAQKEAA